MGDNMKGLIIITVIAVAGVAQVALASDVGVGVDIHIGNRPAVVPVPVPAPPPPPVVIEEPPLFLYPPELGFGVAVGVPHDIYFISGSYYLYRGDHWYRAPHYDGPWYGTRYRSLPPGLRRHRLEQMHYYRDREYRAYHDEHEHYRGRHYRPDKETKKEWKEQRKEEKRWEKEERKQEKRHGNHWGHE
jgi:hypothetical protein